MWTGFCGAFSSGYVAVTGWANIVCTATGNGIAAVGQKMLGM